MDVAATVLAVSPPKVLATETDDDDFQKQITHSELTVRFDDGTLVDGSNTKLISGFYISCIYGDY